MVSQALARFGRVDCLVNNAGAPLAMVGVADTDMATFDAIMAVNVRGALLGMKHVAPAMLAQGSGSIVNVASVAGLRGGVEPRLYGLEGRGPRADPLGRGGARRKGIRGMSRRLLKLSKRSLRIEIYAASVI